MEFKVNEVADKTFRVYPHKEKQQRRGGTIYLRGIKFLKKIRVRKFRTIEPPSLGYP